jgi:AraC-like DNA-binding protein
MKLQIKYDINIACKVILQEQLEKLGISYQINGLGEVELKNELTDKEHKELEQSVDRYGIQIMDNPNPKIAMAQRIKEVINEMVYREDKLPYSKISDYITYKMKLSYSYLSKIFSDVTHSSIENYIILQRIERAKQMIIEEKLTLSEVAWKLNYSSLAHLSNQFKKTTGLSPSMFQRIIERRNNIGLTSEIN